MQLVHSAGVLGEDWMYFMIIALQVTMSQL